MKVAIVANGSCRSYPFLKKKLMAYDKIVAADGGINHLAEVGITPDSLLGDMDSVRAHYRADAVPFEMIELPSHKDLTDLEFAIDYALAERAEQVDIFCAFGGRVDHTLTNLNLLRLYDNKTSQIRFMDERQIVRRLRQNDSIRNAQGQTFSIIPMTDLIALTIKGARYPLSDKNVRAGSSLCQSNIAEQQIVLISLAQGEALLVLLAKDSTD